MGNTKITVHTLLDLAIYGTDEVMGSWVLLTQV